jgi:hypothetical protein
VKLEPRTTNCFRQRKRSFPSRCHFTAKSNSHHHCLQRNSVLAKKKNWATVAKSFLFSKGHDGELLGSPGRLKHRTQEPSFFLWTRVFLKTTDGLSVALLLAAVVSHGVNYPSGKYIPPSGVCFTYLFRKLCERLGIFRSPKAANVLESEWSKEAFFLGGPCAASPLGLLSSINGSTI